MIKFRVKLANHCARWTLYPNVGVFAPLASPESAVNTLVAFDLVG